MNVLSTPSRSERADPTGARIRTQVHIGLDRKSRVAARLVSFDGLADAFEHVALVVDSPDGQVPLVRVHSECLTGDIFGSRRCDCGPQLDEAMASIANGGVILYLRQEGRGIGLYNKIDAYELQDRDIDTFTANRMLGRQDDERNFAVAAQMLFALGVPRIRLLTNNPQKVRQLAAFGIEVVEVVPTRVFSNPDNARYLNDKAVLAGHSIDVSEALA
jgi:GTP cyclohydrolase II